MRAWFLSVLVCALGAWVGDLAAQSIDREVLPSGLTVIIGELHLTQAVEVRVAVRAGPLHEGALLGSGVSLLTQRLIASGGQNANPAAPLTSAEVREALARLGDRFSAETTPAGAVFSITTTSGNLANALRLLAGMVTAPAFGADDLERERKALADAKTDPESETLMALLYRVHPARLPLAGVPALREQLTLDAIRAYRAERYRAANTVVVVAGNVNTNEVRRLVAQDFSDYPLGGFAAPITAVEPPPFAPRYQSVTAPAGSPPRVTFAWRTEASEHANQPALNVLACLLGGDHGLVQRAFAPKRLADHVVVANHAFPDQSGFFSIAFTTTADNRAEAEQALYKALEALDANGPLNDEFGAARKQAMRELALQQAGVHGMCAELQAWEYATGDPAYGRRFADQVQEVTVQDVARVLRRYLQSRDGERGRCTIVLRPLDAALASVENATVPHPTALIPPAVVPLGRGVRLLVRPAAEVPLASVHLILGGGASCEDTLQQGATAMLAETLCRATESRTPGEITALLEARGMRLTTRASLHGLDLGITCFPADVDQALELLMDCLTKAALPPDEIERARIRCLHALEDADARWDARLLAETRRIALADHYAARDPLGSKESLAHLDRSLLIAHLHRLAVGANAVFAVYGHVDPEAIANKLKILVAAHSELSEGSAARPQGSAWPEQPAPPLTVGTHDLPLAALALAWHAPALDDRARDEASMAVLGALLDGRINRALLAQGVSQHLESGGESYDRRGLWLVWGLVDETRLEAAQQSVRDEIARCIAQLWLPENDHGALPESELASAKARCVTAWALAQEDQDRTAVSHAISLLFAGKIDVDLAAPERLAAVSRKDLLRVAQAWLAGEPVSVIYKPKNGNGAPRTTAEPAPVPPPSVPVPPAVAPLAPTGRGDSRKSEK